MRQALAEQQGQRGWSGQAPPRAEQQPYFHALGGALRTAGPLSSVHR